MKTKLILLTLLLITATSIASGQRSGIRSVDLRNFNYGPLCASRHQFLSLPAKNLVLRNGHANHGDKSNYADIGPVRYVDLDGDGREEAFVIINGQTAGSSNAYLAAYVLAYENRRARPLWTICEENSTAKLDGRSIVFTSPEWAKGDAHCCFSHTKTDIYSLRGGKMQLISTSRKRAGVAETRETAEQLAVKFAAAFDAGDLGTFDAARPYRGLVTIISVDSLSSRTTRKSFTTLKQATAWLKRYTPDVNFVKAELDRCGKGVCKFRDAQGLLHNSLYLRQFTYSTIKGHHHVKTISILDGD